IGRQSLCGCKTGKAVSVPPAYATSVRSYPDISSLILDNTFYIIVCQTLFCSISCKVFAVVPVDSTAQGTKPDIAGFILHYFIHYIAGQSVLGCKICKCFT